MAAPTEPERAAPLRPATRDLIFTARASAKASTRALADRVSKMLDQLQERVDAERAAAELAERRAAEVREAKAEITRLQAVLRQAKKRASGKEYDPKAVRAWAKTSKVPCPHFGPLPRAVVEAWRKATA